MVKEKNDEREHYLSPIYYCLNSSKTLSTTLIDMKFKLVYNSLIMWMNMKG